MFELVRGSPNIVAEVQRWQYFLRRTGIGHVGLIDGDFGLNTETATKFYQVANGLPVTGAADAATLQAAATAGYTILPADYYARRADRSYPPAPANLSSPSNGTRNRDFGCFRFSQLDRPPRPDPEAIVIAGSCDGTVADWVSANIVQFHAPQLAFAQGYPGTIRCHRLAAPVIKALLAAWEKADLLHLIRTYDGAFVPRYKRKQAPSKTQGHPAKQSKDVAALSNHAFGSAFDINAGDNPLGDTPALCGERGSVRELVEAANAAGIYWGGHFSTADGMHFEVSALVPALALVAGAAVAAAPAALAAPAILGAALPAAAPPGPAPADSAAHWFKTTFGAQIAAAVAGTPFSIDLVTAIALQETSYIWRRAYRTAPVADVLAACAGDTLDAPRRSAFPKNRAELEAEPQGARMFQLAHAALVNAGRYDQTLKLVAKNPDKFCHGYGIFQYDIQFFKKDPDYFLNEDWKVFDKSLGKCLDELKSALTKTYGKNKTTLTHAESVYVAIAYNRGRANLSKDFKQGFKDGSGVYYGQYIDNFIDIASRS